MAVCVCMCVYSQSFLTLCNPMDEACQALLPMEISRQEYWSELPFPTPEDLSDPGIKPKSPASLALADGFFTIALLGKSKDGQDLPRQEQGWGHLGKRNSKGRALVT